ncbi:hypothetical protein C7447_104142 [Tenacibaculum adriaticum]|uniref:Response receiver domain-containing protein n=1 Tax=Tenacibaculum adriaticum TaxID=413713 RepID=A0A5S5DR26_9FLAO|nr:hypothetical protein [Tenacibaculum adriaticum]TYP97456.1 hypothetical protein C7447_104142 [Tenacibaculum adriaticum]
MIQQYFKTGKTIVIDDQYEEAKPLLDALTRLHIPFIYSQGKPNSKFPLPDRKNPFHYNLVFMDLNLDFKFTGGLSTEGNQKTFKGLHSQILNNLLKNDNRSFILIIWSNEEEEYRDHYLNIFEDEEKYRTDKRPYKIISLSKPDFFQEQEDGTFKFLEEKETELKEKINKELSKLEAFNLLCEWDKVVSQSAGDAIDDIMGLVNKIPDENQREEHLAKILTAMSIAYSGDKGYLNFNSNQERTDSVLLTLTQLLNDDIDRNVLNQRQQEFTGWKAKDTSEINQIRSDINPSLLNNKLLIFQPNKSDLTGSVYKSKYVNVEFKDIFTDSINKDKACKQFLTRYKKWYKIKNLDQAMTNIIRESYCDKYIYNRSTPIEINLSPLCDIVQDKIVYHRIVSGYIMPASFYNSTKSDLAYFVKSPVFNYDGNDVFIGLDLRHLVSCTKTDIEQKDYLFTLRTNLVNDIQTKLASHVSRLGVLNL